MINRKLLWGLFGLLTVINLFIYLKRDSFQYVPYKGYDHLYKEGAIIFTNAKSIYTTAELQQARMLTQHVVHDTMSTMEKLEGISTFLLSRFHDQRGLPPQHLLNASALQTYDALVKSKNNIVWCGHFGNMMLLFGAANSIKGRYIEVFNPGDHHVFTEFFIPELDEWVMVDMYNDIIFARDQNNTFLNAQSFRKEVTSSRPVKISAWKDSSVVDTILNKETAAIRSYHTRPNQYYYYKTINLQEAYSIKNKLKRYVSKDSWYYIYQDTQASNFRHYTKIGFLAGWLFLGLFLIYVKVQRRA